MGKNNYKDSILSTITSTIISAIIIFIINYAVTASFSPNGNITISSLQNDKDCFYQDILITSWKDNFKPICMTIYSDNLMVTSGEIKYIQKKIDDQKTELEVYDIPTNKPCILHFIYPSRNGKIIINNLKEINFEEGIKRKNIIKETFWNTLPLIILYTLSTLVSASISQKHTNRLLQYEEEKKKILQEQFENIQKEKDSLKDDLNNVKKELNEKSQKIHKTYSNYKLVLTYKIHDLSKEVDFWHNFVYEMLFKIYGKDKTKAKELINEIQKKIETPGNVSKLNDPKSVEYYEGLLKDET